MQLDFDLHFPADAHAVGQMLADPEFVRWVSARTGAGTVETADVVGTAKKGFVVSVRRTVPAEQVIASVRPLAGHAIEIRQVEAWEPEVAGRRRGTAVYEIKGADLRALATLELVPVTATTSRIGFDGTVTSQIPVVAQVLERAMATRVRGLFAELEHAAGIWLTRPSSAPTR